MVYVLLSFLLRDNVHTPVIEKQNVERGCMRGKLEHNGANLKAV